MKTNSYDNAMPVHGGYMSNGDYDDPRNGVIQGGLTKREHFAAMAMQGICGDGIPGSHHKFDITARDAVAYADALIAALNKEEQ